MAAKKANIFQNSTGFEPILTRMLDNMNGMEYNIIHKTRRNLISMDPDSTQKADDEPESCERSLP